MCVYVCVCVRERERLPWGLRIEGESLGCILSRMRLFKRKIIRNEEVLKRFSLN